MNIIIYEESNEKKHWEQEIAKSDWDAGQFLHELLTKNQMKEACGETTRTLLLTDGDKLVSFCTLAEQDDVREPSMTPWIGFVYTYPEYREHHHVGQLLKYADELAGKDGAKQIYISTGHTGLYEKYGYSFYKIMKDMHGEDSRIYIKLLSD